MKDNKKAITILIALTIIFTLVGGSLAYWTWDSEFKSNLVFTLSKDFSCGADGGEDLNSDTIQLVPTTCDNTNNRVIKREIKVTTQMNQRISSLNLNMWLKVDRID